MKRDFTVEVKDQLKELVEDKNEIDWSVSTSEYVDDLLNPEVRESWSSLESQVENIRLRNNLSVTKIEEIWNNVQQLDAAYSMRLLNLSELAEAYLEKLKLIREKIKPEMIINTLEGNPQILKDEFLDVTETIHNKKVNYGFEKLIVRNAKYEITDYNWELIEEYMQMDPKNIPLYQYDAFVRLFDQLDCTLEKDRKIMEKFIENAYLKSEYVTEGGWASSNKPLNEYRLSDVFRGIIERYCGRNTGELKEYQVLNSNIFSFLNSFGEYFMVGAENAFEVKLSHGINIEDIGLSADLKYDFTIEFPEAKITKESNVLRWAEVEEAQGWIFQARDGESAQSILSKLNIRELYGMKKDKGMEIMRAIIGTAGDSMMGAGMSTGQGFVFTGATTILDAVSISVEVEQYNDQIDQQINQTEMGFALSSLGAENVNVQAYGNQGHVNVTLQGKETYERLYAYYLCQGNTNEESAAELAKKAMEEWTKGGKIDLDNKEVLEYQEWYYYEDGKNKMENIRNGKNIS